MSKRPIFTVAQFDRLSNIFDNAGQIIFGVVVLSPLITGLKQVNWLVEICGIIVTIGSWLISIRLARKGFNL